MTTAAPKESLTQSAYERIRLALLTGALLPGERLKTADLCESLSINLSAVREALARLSSEGLVVSEPQRGFRAAPISAADLLDLTRARIELETLCLRRAMAVGDVAWEASVVAASHALKRTPFASPLKDPAVNQQWCAVHEQFHRALCASCDSPWLLRLREILYVQSERYRLLAAALGGARPAAQDEHDDIVDALMARDSDRAVALMAYHLELTTTSLLERLSPSTPDLKPEQLARACWLREAMNYTPPATAGTAAAAKPGTKAATANKATPAQPADRRAVTAALASPGPDDAGPRRVASSRPNR